RRAVGTELPPGLQRAAALRAAGVEAVPAVGAGHEVDADRRVAAGAQRPDLFHLGDDAEELFGAGRAGLDLRQRVLAERDHAAGDRGVADDVFARLRRDEAADLVVDAHHFVDA